MRVRVHTCAVSANRNTDVVAAIIVVAGCVAVTHNLRL